MLELLREYRPFNSLYEIPSSFWLVEAFLGHSILYFVGLSLILGFEYKEF